MKIFAGALAIVALVLVTIGATLIDVRLGLIVAGVGCWRLALAVYRGDAWAS